jgi:hypothetical protein
LLAFIGGCREILGILEELPGAARAAATLPPATTPVSNDDEHEHEGWW